MKLVMPQPVLKSDFQNYPNLYKLNYYLYQLTVIQKAIPYFVQFRLKLGIFFKIRFVPQIFIIQKNSHIMNQYLYQLQRGDLINFELSI
jgi:hypothetical protein